MVMPQWRPRRQAYIYYIEDARSMACRSAARARDMAHRAYFTLQKPQRRPLIHDDVARRRQYKCDATTASLDCPGINDGGLFTLLWLVRHFKPKTAGLLFTDDGAGLFQLAISFSFLPMS